MARRILRMRMMDVEDLLSELPEEVIHHIMYSLPTLEATRMSVLSKRFFSMWRSLPVIDFDLDQLRSHYSAKDLIDFVVRSLERRRNYGVLQRLRVSSVRGYDDNDDKSLLIKDMLESVINFAIRNKTEELDLDYSTTRKPFYLLPMPIKSLLFSSKCLKSLRLGNIYFGGHYNLILTCPLIEDLKLRRCIGLKSIEITSAAQLIRAVNFTDCASLESIRIEPHSSLQSFTCKCSGHEYYHVSCDTNFNLASLESLKHLHLVSVNITDEWLDYHVSRFVGLESLVLEDCRKIKNILITGENNKSLRKFVFRCRTTPSDANVRIAAPSIEHLRIDDDGYPAKLNISGCKSTLRSLCLTLCTVNDEWIRKNLSGFRSLEKFRFRGRSVKVPLFEKAKHKLYFDSLKELDLGSELLLSSELEIEAPNLESITYTPFRGIDADSAPLRLICPNLTDARLSLQRFGKNLDDPVLHKILIELLRSFGHCKTCSLFVYPPILDKFQFSEHERKTLIPPLYEVKHLIVSSSSISPKDVPWLVDTSLWLVPHPETVSFKLHENNHNMITEIKKRKIVYLVAPPFLLNVGDIVYLKLHGRTWMTA
ncbi:F-box domain containing protein [Trema orientale]|uniref:F-box domain containing protein n=1 Tax=Trema orientale TaxID=63057 RepID=A0A2P5BD49_TREOI|nr:F-box domain containing protein [Trema orientale]